MEPGKPVEPGEREGEREHVGVVNRATVAGAAVAGIAASALIAAAPGAGAQQALHRRGRDQPARPAPLSPEGGATGRAREPGPARSWNGRLVRVAGSGFFTFPQYALEGGHTAIAAEKDPAGNRIRSERGKVAECPNRFQLKACRAILRKEKCQMRETRGWRLPEATNPHSREISAKLRWGLKDGLRGPHYREGRRRADSLAAGSIPTEAERQCE